MASAASLALATGALAADLPNVKGPPAYVPPPPVFTWSGFYLGGQIGEQWGTTSSHAEVTSSGAFAIGTPNYQSQGVVGGAHAGFNLQVTQFVFGIEGDVEGSSFDGSGPNATGLHIVQTSIPIQGSIRARASIAWDRALIYATGGAALASINSGATAISGALAGASDAQS